MLIFCLYFVNTNKYVYILFGRTFKYKKFMSSNIDYVLNICKYMYIKIHTQTDIVHPLP